MMNFSYLSCFVLMLILQENCVSSDNVLNVCFICGKGCQEDIQDLDTYLSTAKRVVNERFASSDIDLRINIGHVENINRYHIISRYAPRARGEACLNVARKNIWGNKFESMQREHECGVGFFLSSSRDSFWNRYGFVGLTASATACKNTGIGILKLTKHFPDRLGITLAHEIGHQLVMPHDCTPVRSMSALVRIATRYGDDITGLVNSISENCGPQNCQRRLMMDSAPLAYYPYPATFSRCSIAYFNFYMGSKNSDFLARFYDTSCIIAGTTN